MTDNLRSTPIHSESSHWEALRHRSQIVSSDPIVKALLDLKNQVEWLQIEPSPSERQARSKQFDEIQLIETMMDRVNRIGSAVLMTCNNQRIGSIDSELQKLYLDLKDLRDRILS
jgi:hypothetical protein